jgi:hypothetical protein|tara:strand:- start:109 stop:471 length:363 start_codon:yes stop_codon:yes gene_type:complete
MTCSVLFAQDNQDAPMGTFLYFSAWGIDGDKTLNENVAQVMTFAQNMKTSGKFKSVRVFMHHTGEKLAIYTLAEAEGWNNLGAGVAFAESKIDMDKPAPFGDTHSDDILVELPMPDASSK